MNASVESIPTSRAGGGRFLVRDGILEVTGPMRLQHGGLLQSLRIGWRLVGPACAPVVAALGGISAHRKVVSDAAGSGWWDEIARPGGALDIDQLRVLSFDFLGGSGATTGPRSGERFPSVSTFDQAELLRHLIDHLGIHCLRAIAGGSYGGMIALAFAERYAQRVAQLIVIGASDAPHPLATGWRSTQRQIVRLALDAGRGTDGLAIARGLAMCTYRSAEELGARFRGPPLLQDGQLVNPIEPYLGARGRAYAAQYCVESFLCLSESIDLHRIDPARVITPATVIAVDTDQLVPLADVRSLAARLPAGRLHVVSSRYGHDAFLKEAEALRGPFAQSLE